MGMGWDTGLADRIRAEGVDVVEVAGWQTRGRSTPDLQGFVWHHTAGGPTGVAPSLNLCINGAAYTAPGPLCNILQSREPDGNDKAYVIAAGTANHAGTGGWGGLSGNSTVWGLEIEHTGVVDYPDNRRATSLKIAAACLRGVGATDAGLACQHFEWSYPPGSKIDVCCGVDPDEWRALTTEQLRHGSGPAPAPPAPNLGDDMHAVCGPLIGMVDNVVLLMSGSNCVAEFDGSAGYDDIFGIRVPKTWTRFIGHEGVQFHYFGGDAFAGAIMKNLRWGGQEGAGLV